MPQGQEPLAPMAQLRRLIVIFTTAVEAVGRNARVRVGLAEGEEVAQTCVKAEHSSREFSKS